MFNLDAFETFVNQYCAHPIWKVIKKETGKKPWLRLAAFSSSRFCERKELSKDDNYYIRDLELSYEQMLAPRIGKALDKLCTEGLQLYWYTNLVEQGKIFEKGRRPAAGDVKAVMYWRLDYDYNLPFGLGALCKRLRMYPWFTVSTSNVGRVAKYQLLFAVDPKDSGRFEEWKELQRRFCVLCGADRNNVDLPRVFRLPGSVNWKYGLEIKGGFGCGMSVGCIAPDVEAMERGEVPDLEQRLFTMDGDPEFRKGLDGFAGCTMSRELIERVAEIEGNNKGYVNGNTGQYLRYSPENKFSVNSINNSDNGVIGGYRLFGVGYREALEKSTGDGNKNKPFIKAGTGQRHNALVSWSGELAVEVARNVLGKADAIQLLNRLNQLCFDIAVDTNGVEWTNIIRNFENLVARDRGRFKAESEKPLLELGPVADQPVTGQYLRYSTENLFSVEDKLLRNSPEDKFSVSSTNTTILDSAFLQGSIRQSSWLRQVKLWLEMLIEFKNQEAMSDPMVQSIFERLQKFGVYNGDIMLPTQRETAWGELVWEMVRPNKTQFRSLFDSILQRIVTQVIGNRKGLATLPELKIIAKKIKEKLVVENTSMEGDVNYSAVKQKLEVAIDNLLTPKLTLTGKRELIHNACDHMANLEQNMKWHEDRIVFQNGVWFLEDGRWTECVGWNDKCAVYASFDVEVAKKAAIGLRERGVSAVLSEHCPLLYMFLNQTFPDDPATLMVVMSMIGYSMLAGNPRHAIFVFSGIAGSGKGTLARLIQKLVGDTKCVSLDYENVPRESEGLVHAVGRHVAIIDEANYNGRGMEGIHKRVWNKLNEITGGSRVRVRGIYAAAFETTVEATPILVLNTMPQFSDDSGASKRRTNILDFSNIPERRIDCLENKILKEEHASIATIASIVLQRRWKLDGVEPFRSAESIAQREGEEVLDESTAPVRAWLRRVLKPCEDGNIPMSFLLLLVEEYCSSAGIDFEGVSKKKSKLLVNDLKLLGIKYNSDNDYTRTNGKKVRCLKGYKLRKELIKDIIKPAGERYNCLMDGSF